MILRSEPGVVIVSVDDDGRGFDSDASTTNAARMGLGRLDMEQRAKLLGGTVMVTSSIGRGAHVECRVPYATKPALVPPAQPQTLREAS